MSSIQIRNMPEDVYRALALRAEQAQRSLAQQALFELKLETSAQAPTRRRHILEAIKRDLPSEPVTILPRPEELIREDRER